jgi:hypothetical protein
VPFPEPFGDPKAHELLQELLEDKSSYGETFFVPPREYMSVALRRGAEVALFLGLLAAGSAAA